MRVAGVERCSVSREREAERRVLYRDFNRHKACTATHDMLRRRVCAKKNEGKEKSCLLRARRRQTILEGVSVWVCVRVCVRMCVRCVARRGWTWGQWIAERMGMVAVVCKEGKRREREPRRERMAGSVRSHVGSDWRGTDQAAQEELLFLHRSIRFASQQPASQLAIQPCKQHPIFWRRVSRALFFSLALSTLTVSARQQGAAALMSLLQVHDCSLESDCRRSNHDL